MKSNGINSGDIERWVSKHFKYKKRRNDTQIVICNPFDGDTKWHFNISLESTKSRRTGKYNYYVHDWRPDKSMWDTNFVRFVANYKNISYFEALKEIKGDCLSALETYKEAINNNSLEEKNENEKEEPLEYIVELPPNCKNISKENLDDKICKISINYLNKRKISLEKAKSYSLKFNTQGIIFPYIEYGEVVYWQLRDVISKRFDFPKQSNKTDYIFGFDNVEPNDNMFITESIIDAMCIGENCIATGGATIVGKQIRKIKALNPDIIVLCPDNDEAGIKSLRQNYDLINNYFVNVKIAYCLPPKSDKYDIKDWNDIEKYLGVGESRKYIINNARVLRLSEIINPRIENV